MLKQNDLRDLQNTGKWPVVESNLLKTKYSNRFQVASELFKYMSSEVFESLNHYEDESPNITEWKDEDLPNKIYSTRHEGPILHDDYMAGPMIKKKIS